MDKTLKLFLAVGVVVISCSIAFYFVYFLPNKDRNKQKITSECAIWAKDKAVKDWARNNGGEKQYSQVFYDGYFERCLREKGI